MNDPNGRRLFFYLLLGGSKRVTAHEQLTLCALTLLTNEINNIGCWGTKIKSTEKTQKNVFSCERLYKSLPDGATEVELLPE